MTNVTATGVNATYVYNADGKRVKQTLGSTVTNYLWDEASPYGDVVYEYNSTGGALASYVLGGTGLISQTRSSTTSYFLQDGQGSTRGLTNSTTGAITDTFSYTAFGESFATTGTTVNPYRYTGQQLDTSTGLYSLRARYYNPALGRFLSQDTYPVNFGHPVELNRYAYTANNPINAMDPSGYSLAEYSISLGRSVGAGALLGGLINGGLDFAMQYYTKGPHNIDVMHLLHSTLAGALIGAFSAVTAGTWGMLAEGDLLATIGYGMFDGYASGLLSRVVMNKLEGQDALAGYTWQNALTDIITGGVMAGVFHGITAQKYVHAAREQNIAIALRERPWGAELLETLGIKPKPGYVHSENITWRGPFGLRKALVDGDVRWFISDSDLGFVWDFNTNDIAPNNYYTVLRDNYGFNFQHGDHINGMNNPKIVDANLDRAMKRSSTLILPDGTIMRNMSLIDMLEYLGYDPAEIKLLLNHK